ncbi:hypothetical protein FOL47_003389 [Perkinsus chesapeaki]|uniref:Uncharacterized protein n=1 Tax=Perkinsus chesapeaki TaxID=330153 RepID=A0A7J6M9C2_PERCH|nr:hypothetical protein FOL47_003389 [Perkinsus chesapeaki]
MVADSITLSLLGEDPRAMSFGFAARCSRNTFGVCVMAGVSEFVVCLVLVGVFVWHFQEKLGDPFWNRWCAGTFSWSVLTGAAEWLPMTVLSAKVTALVSYSGDTWSWIECSMAVTVALVTTIVCTLCVHGALHRGGSAIFVPHTMSQYLTLLTMYCTGVSVGTSWWLIIYVTFLKSQPNSLFLSLFWSAGVTTAAVIFYNRYGPEPIMPHGNHTSSSLKRSALSFMVYASVVCTANANHSTLKCLIQSLHSFNFPVDVDAQGLLLLAFTAWFVTMFAAFLGYWITRTTQIGFGASGRFSRMAVDDADHMQSPWGVLAEQSALIVMTFDCLSLLSAYQWGTVSMGCFVLLIGSWALQFTPVYLLGSLIYASVVVLGVSWFCRTYIPSDAEKAMYSSSLPLGFEPQRLENLPRSPIDCEASWQEPHRYKVFMFAQCKMLANKLDIGTSQAPAERLPYPQESSFPKLARASSGVDLRLTHYQAMREAIAARNSLVLGAGLYRVSRRRAAIPGYGGFIPCKDSANVLGCSYRRANLVASEIMERLNPHLPPAESLC